MGIKRKYTGAITRTVWVLSLVSMFTDISSEMLYPVMPLYLKSIGFSVVLIGILEGFADKKVVRVLKTIVIINWF